MSHLNEPQLEIAVAAPPPAPQTPFEAFEAAVNDSTLAAPTGAAVLDAPGLQTETNRTPATEIASPDPLPSAPDIAAPWGDGAAPVPDGASADPLIAPRPRRSQLGMTLFISLVFLPLVLYAILVTILAVMFYQQRGEGNQPDPRQFLPDVEGDHPGFKRSNKQSLAIPDRYYKDPLPASLRVGLGQALTIGDLEVLAERVEWAKVSINLGRAGPFEVDHPALVLHLKIRNISRTVSIYPLDAYFNRQWAEGEGEKPLTFVEAGPARYYGGPARWRAKEPEVIEGANYDKSLEPGESDDYLVCSNCYEPETQKLGKYTGSLLWRVQLRRGLVRFRDKDLSATAVIGVEFTDKDIVHTWPGN
jgi:hypothetical protein